MSEKLGAVLIAEIGSITTRVVLADTVEGETRLIGLADVNSTTERPYNDAMIGILDGAARIAERTGRHLLDDGRLVMPQTTERDGVNHVLATTSAAGNLELIITAIASDISAGSALRATQGIYADVLQVVTLDDAAHDAELRRSSSWVQRQVQPLLGKNPHVLLLTGGLEGGAEDMLCRLAQMLRFVISHYASDRTRQRSNTGNYPVIYAGNSQARDCVEKALGEQADVSIVDNLRPTLEQEQLEATRRELVRLYHRLVLSQLPGLRTLQNLCSASVPTVVEVAGLMTRFLAERYERRVLLIDVGSASSSALYATPGRYIPTIHGLCGSGYGVMAVMQARGLANIIRWLPFEMREHDMLHWLLNKQVRPQVVPASREDVLIEQAIAREVLILVHEMMRGELPDLSYDLVVACGGVLTRASHPGLALLTVLDALQPTAEAETMAIDFHLDTLGLVAACGTLTALEPEGAVTLFERDLLRNTPLATCVVALGNGKVGDVAVEAELISGRGVRQQIAVKHGQIARIPLAQGTRGKLTLRPASGVRIGGNEPGAEVSSEVAAINGSALGVVIDARGRPLRLASRAEARREQLWEWLVALGAEHGTPPAISSTTVAVPELPETQATSNGSSEPLPPPVNEASLAPEAPELPPDEPSPFPMEMPLPLTTGSDEVPAADETMPAKGQRVSLSDLPPLETDPSETASAEGRRVSLSDLPPLETDPSETTPDKGRRISLSDLSSDMAGPLPTSPVDEQGGPALEDDLASLRDPVEEPKKRGLFGRRKK